MGKLIDLTGQRFGRLTVVERAGTSCGHARWLCRCDCGKKVMVSSPHLRTGHTSSCGCLRRDKAQQAHIVHGDCQTRLYHIWKDMKRRCYSPNVKHYNYYGGRGIKICAEWEHSYETFRDWAVAHGYQDDLTIDRVNVDDDYCPENCRFITVKAQANNRRNSINLTFSDRTLTVAQWANEIGIPYMTLISRINRGWSVERALTEPIHQSKKTL